VTQWYDRAACRGLDVELFYSERPQDRSAALAVCATCPVRQPCHDAAMSGREAHGVWGGTPDKARRRIFRREDRQRRQAARAA